VEFRSPFYGNAEARFGKALTPAKRERSRGRLGGCSRRDGWPAIGSIANQYAIQRSQTVTTVVGIRTMAHLKSAIEAAATPIDEALLGQRAQ
jgi:hypothetical protein